MRGVAARVKLVLLVSCLRLGKRKLETRIVETGLRQISQFPTWYSDRTPAASELLRSSGYSQYTYTLVSLPKQIITSQDAATSSHLAPKTHSLQPSTKQYQALILKVSLIPHCTHLHTTYTSLFMIYLPSLGFLQYITAQD